MTALELSTSDSLQGETLRTSHSSWQPRVSRSADFWIVIDPVSIMCRSIPLARVPIGKWLRGMHNCFFVLIVTLDRLSEDRKLYHEEPSDRIHKPRLVGRDGLVLNEEIRPPGTVPTPTLRDTEPQNRAVDPSPPSNRARRFNANG